MRAESITQVFLALLTEETSFPNFPSGRSEVANSLSRNFPSNPVCGLSVILTTGVAADAWLIERGVKIIAIRRSAVRFLLITAPALALRLYEQSTSSHRDRQGDRQSLRVGTTQLHQLHSLARQASHRSL